jgi:hypothetical protein
MLFWKASFQIPDSYMQSLNVYAVVKENIDSVAIVDFYSDLEKKIFMFSKTFSVLGGIDVYECLLTLDYFKDYKRIS